jgi:hypothetical protein
VNSVSKGNCLFWANAVCTHFPTVSFSLEVWACACVCTHTRVHRYMHTQDKLAERAVTTGQFCHPFFSGSLYWKTATIYLQYRVLTIHCFSDHEESLFCFNKVILLNIHGIYLCVGNLCLKQLSVFWTAPTHPGGSVKILQILTQLLMCSDMGTAAKVTSLVVSGTKVTYGYKFFWVCMIGFLR